MNAWENKELYKQTAQKLTQQFRDNFKKFSATPLGVSLVNAGPKQ